MRKLSSPFGHSTEVSTEYCETVDKGSRKNHPSSFNSTRIYASLENCGTLESVKVGLQQYKSSGSGSVRQSILLKVTC